MTFSCSILWSFQELLKARQDTVRGSSFQEATTPSLNYNYFELFQVREVCRVKEVWNKLK